jgi:hypothetical protein
MHIILVNIRFVHLKVMLVFVEGNLRMHCLCNLYMRKIDSGLV